MPRDICLASAASACDVAHSALIVERDDERCGRHMGLPIFGVMAAQSRHAESHIWEASGL